MLGTINRLETTTRDWHQGILTSKSTTNHITLPDSAAAPEWLPYQDEVSERKEKINKALSKLNEQLAFMDRSFRFKYNEDAELYFVQVIDVRTQEVIESLPPDYLLELSAKLKDMIGLFIDKRM